MVKVLPSPPGELPSVAWVPGVPLTGDLIRACRTTEVPAAPTTGVCKRRVAADSRVTSSPVAEVDNPGNVNPGDTTNAPLAVHGPAHPVPPFPGAVPTG